MADYVYAKWEGGEGFSRQSADEVFRRLTDHIFQHGDQILRRLDDGDPETAEILRKLREAGRIERDETGEWSVTPAGMRAAGERALSELFQKAGAGASGTHETGYAGAGEAALEETRPYVYGDSLSHLDMHETLRNATARGGAGKPIRIGAEDLAVRDTERQVRRATVLLIDMSGSMGRFGKYGATKRIALALAALVRTRHPQDALRIVGFHSHANELTERELFRSAPKRVSLFDPLVHMRIDLDAPPKFVPEHFTNIHAGLRLARWILAREGTANKQIILVTDGEPTAHLEGRELHLIYPPSERTAEATLAEARRCREAGIAVSSFALIEDSFYFGLVNFVGEMARATRGVAAYCGVEDLGRVVLESFARGRRERRTTRG